MFKTKALNFTNKCETHKAWVLGKWTTPTDEQVQKGYCNMKFYNKKIVEDILYKELEAEFHHFEGNIKEPILKDALNVYIDFVKSYFKGWTQFTYLKDLKQDLEKWGSYYE